MQGRLDDIPRTEPWSELSRDLFGVIAFRMSPTSNPPSMSAELSAVCQAKFRCIDQVTDKIPNSPAHQVSLPYSSTARRTPPPSSPSTRPGASILLDSRYEGSLMANNRLRTGNKRIEQSRRAPLASYRDY